MHQRHVLFVSCVRVCLRPRVFLAVVVGAAASLFPVRQVAHAQQPAAACDGLVPTAVGGPKPPDRVVALRWLGTANYELAYRNTVVLLDAYYDRGPRNRPIGITPDAVSHADVIFIGHAHFDHISDAASIALKTRALVVGAPQSIKVVLASGVPPSQTRVVTGKGGEVLQFDGFTVEPILAHHSVLSPLVIAKFHDAIATVLGAPTPADSAAEAAIIARGSFDPSISTEGTIAYLFTFDGGFRLIFLDSAGPITDAERDVMARIGRTDVAIVAYAGQYVAQAQVAATLPLVKLFKSDLYLPAHHDEIAGFGLDLGLEPLFMAIREQLPGTKTIAPLYLSPVCVNADRRAH
jgi:L-ascorbate metabolism protein UlaG (beta-lactamase superfamily)